MRCPDRIHPVHDVTGVRERCGAQLDADGACPAAEQHADHAPAPDSREARRRLGWSLSARPEPFC